MRVFLFLLVTSFTLTTLVISHERHRGTKASCKFFLSFHYFVELVNVDVITLIQFSLVVDQKLEHDVT